MSMGGILIEREKNRKAMNLLKGKPIDHGAPVERAEPYDFMGKYRARTVDISSRQLKPTGKGGKYKWPR